MIGDEADSDYLRVRWTEEGSAFQGPACISQAIKKGRTSSDSTGSLQLQRKVGKTVTSHQNASP